eukprot:1160568-Pelagomonas_calceolata.AAC.16
MIVALEPTGPEGAFNGALTTIRLLRLLKLARYWKVRLQVQVRTEEIRSHLILTTCRTHTRTHTHIHTQGLKIVLRILGFAVRSGIYLLMLVLLFMFVMGLLGLQVRGVHVRHGPAGAAGVKGAKAKPAGCSSL